MSIFMIIEKNKKYIFLPIKSKIKNNIYKQQTIIKINLLIQLFLKFKLQE
jgi:hypothetical protein